MLQEIKKIIIISPHLQCTIMGLFPDCCCCLCTAAMRSIIPLPSAGIPISGQPWKWKSRTCWDCFSWRDEGGKRSVQHCVASEYRFKGTAWQHFKNLKKKKKIHILFLFFYDSLKNNNTTTTYRSVGEHHVFESEGVAQRVSSQLHRVIFKYNTAL